MFYFYVRFLFRKFEIKTLLMFVLQRTLIFHISISIPVLLPQQRS